METGLLRRVVFGLSLSIMFIFGASDMLRGVVAPFLQRGLHLNYLQLGYLFSGNSLGYLLGSLLAGFAIERMGLRKVNVLGVLVNVCGILWIANGSSFLSLLLGFLVMGLGGGWLEIAVNGVVPAMASSNHGQARLFNWLHGFYGIGAFTFPVVAAWWIARTHGNWHSIYLVLAVILGASLLLVVFANYRGLHPTANRGDDSTSAKQFFRNPVLYGLVVAIVAYVMAEVGMATWLPTYLIHVHGFSLTQGSLYLSGFYFTFTVGRLTAHLWVPRAGSERAVLLSSIAAVVLLVFGWSGQGWLLGAFIVAGFGFAVIFPTITAVASHTFPNHAGKVLGLLFSASAMGSLTANSLIGLISIGFGIRTGFLLIAVFMLLVTGSILFVTWQQRRVEQGATPYTEVL